MATVLNQSGRFEDYLGPIFWDISAADYDFWRLGKSSVAAAAAYLEHIARTERGIVLFHDSSENETLRRQNQVLALTTTLVPLLKNRGYRFVSLAEAIGL